MNPKITGFDWDEANCGKCRKHGVSTAEIEAVLQKPIAVVPDPRHSRAETRFKAIGTTDENRHVLIVFTLRSRDSGILIRPISARYMHRKEVAYYEEGVTRATER